MKTLAAVDARTAPDLIGDCAALICQHGWCVAGDPGTPTMSLTTAAIWAVAGPGRALRDLTEVEAQHVAELLDHLEEGLGMPVDQYTRTRQHVGSFSVALDLEIVAMEYARALRV